MLLGGAPWQSAAERRRYGGAFAGRGAVAELLAVSAMAKRMAALWQRAIGKLSLARGAAAEHHREAATAGNESHCRKGEILLERRTTAGKESHCQKGRVRSATAGKKGLQRSNGLVSFFDAPLMQIIPIFVVW